MKNLKTTLAGVFLGLGLLFGQLGAVLDDDPTTNMNSAQLVAALASIGGAFGLGWFSTDKSK